jgi:hypothetical protein
MLKQTNLLSRYNFRGSIVRGSTTGLETTSIFHNIAQSVIYYLNPVVFVKKQILRL